MQTTGRRVKGRRYDVPRGNSPQSIGKHNEKTRSIGYSDSHHPTNNREHVRGEHTVRGRKKQTAAAVKLGFRRINGETRGGNSPVDKTNGKSRNDQDHYGRQIR